MNYDSSYFEFISSFLTPNPKPYTKSFPDISYSSYVTIATSSIFPPGLNWLFIVMALGISSIKKTELTCGWQVAMDHMVEYWLNHFKIKLELLPWGVMPFTDWELHLSITLGQENNRFPLFFEPQILLEEASPPVNGSFL